MYAAMLLGFIIQSNPAMCDWAVSHLRGGSLRNVVAAIGRGLHFYIKTGAITEATRETMVKLLVALQASEAALLQQG